MKLLEYTKTFGYDQWRYNRIRSGKFNKGKELSHEDTIKELKKQNKGIRNAYIATFGTAAGLNYGTGSRGLGHFNLGLGVAGAATHHYLNKKLNSEDYQNNLKRNYEKRNK